MAKQTIPPEKGEKLITEFPISKRLPTSQIITIPLITAIIIWALTIAFRTQNNSLFILFYVCSLLLLTPIFLLAYSQLNYTLTNKRILIREGIIGHTITSYPFEKITHIEEGKTWLEILFGIGHVQFQMMGGTQGVMAGLHNPTETLQKILLAKSGKRTKKSI